MTIDKDIKDIKKMLQKIMDHLGINGTNSNKEYGTDQDPRFPEIKL